MWKEIKKCHISLPFLSTLKYNNLYHLPPTIPINGSGSFSYILLGFSPHLRDYFQINLSRTLSWITKKCHAINILLSKFFCVNLEPKAKTT